MKKEELQKMLEERVGKHNELYRELIMLRGEIRFIQTLINKMVTDEKKEKEPVI